MNYGYGKTRKDYNSGKCGWIGGNPRYKRCSRNEAAQRKHRSMKGLKRS